jgi:ABC-type transport system involved in cytochrome c biogenesis ATPase subunit
MQPEETCALSPAQQAAADGVLKGIAIGDVVVLQGDAGSGKTTVLRTVHGRLGGAFLGMQQFMETLVRQPGIEEALLRLLEETLQKHDLVIIDDLHLILNVVEGCGYQREHLLDAALAALLGEARSNHKKLLFAVEDRAPWPVRRRAYS